MESKNIYDDSYKELSRIQKSNSTDQVAINYSKLDSQSAGMVKQALNNVIAKRKKEIKSVILGVQ